MFVKRLMEIKKTISNLDEVIEFCQNKKDRDEKIVELEKETKETLGKWKVLYKRQKLIGAAGILFLLNVIAIIINIKFKSDILYLCANISMLVGASFMLEVLSDKLMKLVYYIIILVTLVQMALTCLKMGLFF